MPEGSDLRDGFGVDGLVEVDTEPVGAKLYEVGHIAEAAGVADSRDALGAVVDGLAFVGGEVIVRGF